MTFVEHLTIFWGLLDCFNWFYFILVKNYEIGELK